MWGCNHCQWEDKCEFSSGAAGQGLNCPYFDQIEEAGQDLLNERDYRAIEDCDFRMEWAEYVGQFRSEGAYV